MKATQSHPVLLGALVRAEQCLQRRDLAGAEAVLMTVAGLGFSQIPQILNMRGAIRLYQGRAAEALPLLARGREAAPHDPMLALNLGRALAVLGRTAEAADAFGDAIRLKPDFVEARFETAQLAHRSGALKQAEDGFRDLLGLMPGNVHAKLALGAVLIDAGRPCEAEVPLREGLDETVDPALKAQFHISLSLALRRQRKDDEALAACDRAATLASGQSAVALHRAEILQNLGRHDEALVLFRDLLARAPGDPGRHHAYNDLLYRLGRKNEYLKSYDTAPQSRALMLGKAFFLSHEKRGAEAHDLYAALLARDPGDKVAAIGAANALGLTKRYGEALAAIEAMLSRFGDDADLYRRAAEAALQIGDPQKAAWACEQGLRLSPQDGPCLAILSIASRMLADDRDESINRYDTLIRVFDLKPPDGFTNMQSFNAELQAVLNRLHPATGEFIGQSLRGGTQTPDRLFGVGHVLLGELRARIDEAVRRYIADLKEDAAHPFLSRRARSFAYAGSWSSRLSSGGFHTNHIHPDGWISSCYYVEVPGVVGDEKERQGWIKFGEPSLDVALANPVRRAIQPVAGRLVLFPSHVWHGTVPFHDVTARTTIAFDVLPAS